MVASWVEGIDWKGVSGNTLGGDENVLCLDKPFWNDISKIWTFPVNYALKKKLIKI